MIATDLDAGGGAFALDCAQAVDQFRARACHYGGPLAEMGGPGAQGMADIGKRRIPAGTIQPADQVFRPPAQRLAGLGGQRKSHADAGLRMRTGAAAACSTTT